MEISDSDNLLPKLSNSFQRLFSYTRWIIVSFLSVANCTEVVFDWINDNKYFGFNFSKYHRGGY